jgi:hypothetical protein
MDFAERHFGENPWPIILGLAAILIVFAAAFVMTQNGRHLLRAVGVAAVAVLLLVVDYAWTTDREKIAGTIRSMADAVKHNDEPALKQYLAPTAVYVQGGEGDGVRFESPLGQTLLKQALDQMRFDLLSVRQLEISAGKRTRKGKADFEVMATGTWNPPLGGSAINFPPTPSSWSIGFSKQQDGRWLADRITPTRLPGQVSERSGLPGFLGKKAF